MAPKTPRLQLLESKWPDWKALMVASSLWAFLLGVAIFPRSLSIPTYRAGEIYPESINQLVTELVPPLPPVREKTRRSRQAHDQDGRGALPSRSSRQEPKGEGSRSDADFQRNFQAYVEIGQEVAGSPFPSIFATADRDWWGFLQSCRVRVAVAKFPLNSDWNRVLVLDNQTGSVIEQVVSSDFILREVYEVPPISEIAAFLALVSRRTDEFSSRTRLVVIYPSEVFYALVGKITNEIRSQGYHPAQLRSVQIRYRRVDGGGYDFEVTGIELRA